MSDGNSPTNNIPMPSNPLCSKDPCDIIVAVRQVQRFVHLADQAARAENHEDGDYHAGREWLWSLCEDALRYAMELTARLEAERQEAVRS